MLIQLLVLGPRFLQMASKYNCVIKDHTFITLLKLASVRSIISGTTNLSKISGLETVPGIYCLPQIYSLVAGRIHIPFTLLKLHWVKIKYTEKIKFFPLKVVGGKAFAAAVVLGGWHCGFKVYRSGSQCFGRWLSVFLHGDFTGHAV